MLILYGLKGKLIVQDKAKNVKGGILGRKDDRPIPEATKPSR